jgi:hypothetical protein
MAWTTGVVIVSMWLVMTVVVSTDYQQLTEPLKQTRIAKCEKFEGLINLVSLGCTCARPPQSSQPGGECRTQTLRDWKAYDGVYLIVQIVPIVLG